MRELTKIQKLILIAMLVISIVTYSTFSYQDSSMKKKVEAILSASLKSPVTIEEFTYSSVFDTVEIRNLVVHNQSDRAGIVLRDVRISLNESTDETINIRSLMINRADVYVENTKNGNNLSHLGQTISKISTSDTSLPHVMIHDFKLGDLRLTRPLPDGVHEEERRIKSLSIANLGVTDKFRADTASRAITSHILRISHNSLIEAKFEDGYNAAQNHVQKIANDLNNLGSSISNSSKELGASINSELINFGNSLGSGINKIRAQNTDETPDKK